MPIGKETEKMEKEPSLLQAVFFLKPHTVSPRDLSPQKEPIPKN